jgi:multidrug resistance efflux pump
MSPSSDGTGSSLKLHPQLRRFQMWILVAFVGLAVALVSIILLVPIDEKVPAVGVVMAEQEQYLYAPEDGIIQEIHAREGDTLKAGDLILTLDSREQENRKVQLEAELKEAAAQLQLKQAQLEKVSKLPLPKEFWHTRNELSEAEEKARHAALEMERYAQLLDQKVASESEYDERKTQYNLAKSEIAKAKTQVEVLNKGLEETIMKEALAELNSATAHVEKLKTDIWVCDSQIGRRKLCSSLKEGKLTLLSKRRIGEAVTKGEELAHVSSGDANRGKLFVGETQVHRIRKGQLVRMKSSVFDSLRYGYIEGHVEETALEPSSLKADDSTREKTYRVMVRIDKTPVPLMLGSSLDARIILRHKPIWKLLFPVFTEKDE